MQPTDKRYVLMLEALEEALEFIEGYVDVVDENFGQPAPNKAMQVSNTILHALGRRPG